MRAERKRDREREMRLENLTKKKSKYTRDADRDIGEKMALGMQTGGGKLEGEAQFDSRLFNQSQGMDSGFGREDGGLATSQGSNERRGGGSVCVRESSKTTQSAVRGSRKHLEDAVSS